MIEQICAFIHNYFVHGRYSGTFTIQDGSIELPFLTIGQCYRINGSRLNDGVYEYGTGVLYDETFTGEIWDMRPPRTFFALAEEITAWQEKYGAAVTSPYASESFETYSRTLATAGNAGGGGNGAPTWQSMFRTQLNQYRKLA